MTGKAIFLVGTVSRPYQKNRLASNAFYRKRCRRQGLGRNAPATTLPQKIFAATKMRARESLRGAVVGGNDGRPHPDSSGMAQQHIGHTLPTFTVRILTFRSPLRLFLLQDLLGLFEFPLLSGGQVLAGAVDEELHHLDARADAFGADQPAAPNRAA